MSARTDYVPMANRCDVCGHLLIGPVAALLHYDRPNGTPSPCERRQATSVIDLDWQRDKRAERDIAIAALRHPSGRQR